MESESGEGEGQNSKPRKRAKSSRKAKAEKKRDTKHIGDLAEMEFMLQAASKGFAVAKPFGDNEHYDVLVDGRSRVWRVQVRSVGVSREHTFVVKTYWSEYRHFTPFTPADIDFLAAFMRGLRIWYLIPVEVIQGRLTLSLYPLGARRSAAECEKYREAWHLLAPKPSRTRH
jgi:hypothetical protein